MVTHLTFGKGTDLLLGHGMAQNMNSWIENGWIDALSKIRKVHIFDFSGHGENEGFSDESLSVENMSKNIEAVCSDLELKQFDYIGFSMGARAGFEFASNNNNINKLISLGMHPGSPKLEEKRFLKRSKAMKNLGEKTGEKKYFIYSKIFQKALDWDGAVHKINWNNKKHLIIMGEKDDNFNLTKELLEQNNLNNLLVLKNINHKNTFDEPNHSLNAIINFLQDRR